MTALAKLAQGAFIPAHPLALNEDKTLDEARQRRLTRYYSSAGVDGIAVGVHTTQFEIHEDEALYERVLTLAKEEMDANASPNFIRIAGVSGAVEVAIKEAQLAKKLGYDAILLSNNGLNEYTEQQLLLRAEAVADIMPIIGFYLQPAVGGRVFTYNYWESFVQIPNVVAIKIAPFDRYLTQEVARAVLRSKRWQDIALYTGNDDSIINDLFTTFEENINGERRQKRIVGGLLGHWSVWTQQSVKLFEQIKVSREQPTMSNDWHLLAQQVTDSNSAFFDSKNKFKGSIAGINEVLRRQGLLAGNWCISDREVLSEGQAEEINRVYQAYPHLHDDEFVKQFLAQDVL